MDKPTGHQSRSLKQAKSKKKPIKVVYISSPMKVKTSVSKFRALVQGLTGRDSDLDDMAKILVSNGVDELQRIPDQNIKGVDYEPSPISPVPTVDHDRESSVSAGSPFELFDDVFTPEMLENFTGFSPSSLFGEA